MFEFILVLIVLAAVGYIIYKDFPKRQDLYDEAAKEENLIATDVADVEKKVETL